MLELSNRRGPGARRAVGGLLPLTMALVLLPGSVALANSAANKLEQETEDRARTEVLDLLRTLCPEQCVLLSVEAKVELEKAGEVTPGFEGLAPATELPVLRSLDAQVVADAQLPQPFRARLKGLVAQRLKALNVPSNVTVDSVAFPPRNAPHLETSPEPASLPASRLQPQLPPAPQPQQPVTPPQAEKPAPTLESRLLDAAVPLAALGMFALVLLVLGGLLYLAARKHAMAGAEMFLPHPGDVAPPAPASSPATTPELPLEQLRRLEKRLAEDRPLCASVVREALERGEHALVAAWVKVLGEGLLDELRGDSSLATALHGVAGELVQSGRPSAQALNELQGRVVAHALSRSTESADRAFAFLEAVRVERFVSAVQALTPRSREVAMRLAPERLRAAALEVLSPEERQDLVLAAIRQPEVNASFAVTVAEELRSRIAESAGGASQAERMLRAVLDGLTREEQDALVAKLKKEGDAAATKSVVVESSLLAAPREAVGAAALSIPPEQLVAYLRGAETPLRAQVAGALPQKLAREVDEELATGLKSSRAEFLAARRTLLAKLGDELARRGVDVDTLAPAGRTEPRLVTAGKGS